MENMREKPEMVNKIQDDNTICDHCGIYGCCSPLECLTETMLKDRTCQHGQAYYEDLTIAWELSRWILLNARTLFKDPSDLLVFHEVIERNIENKMDLGSMISLHDKWDQDLIDHGIGNVGQRWSDRYSKDEGEE